MSVVKWIHLNWGDDGVRRLFKKVYEHLEDGGLFVLEAQPWSSYKKKQRASEASEIFKVNCPLNTSYCKSYYLD